MKNENPLFYSGFCATGEKEDIPTIMKDSGFTVANPNINGYEYNMIFNQLFTYINHLKRKGMSFYDSTIAYDGEEDNKDIVRRDNKIYFCKQSHNIDGESPKLPETNPDYWTLLIDLDNPIYEEIKKYSLLNHNHDSHYAKASDVLTAVPLNAKFTDTNTNTWRPVSNDYNSTSESVAPTLKALKTVYDLSKDNDSVDTYYAFASPDVDIVTGQYYTLDMLAFVATKTRLLAIGSTSIYHTDGDLNHFTVGMRIVNVSDGNIDIHTTWSICGGKSGDIVPMSFSVASFLTIGKTYKIQMIYTKVNSNGPSFVKHTHVSAINLGGIK